MRAVAARNSASDTSPAEAVGRHDEIGQADSILCRQQDTIAWREQPRRQLVPVQTAIERVARIRVGVAGSPGEDAGIEADDNEIKARHNEARQPTVHDASGARCAERRIDGGYHSSGV